MTFDLKKKEGNENGNLLKGFEKVRSDGVLVLSEHFTHTVLGDEALILEPNFERG